MILGLLGMAVANAAALLGAHAILRRVRTGDGTLDAVLFLLLRLVLIAAVVLAAGLARVLNPLALGILGSAGLALLLATGEHRRISPLARPDLGWILGAAAAVVGLKLILQVWFFAPYSVDPLSYHLPKVAVWVQQAALFPFPGADVRETFPAGFELFEAWWCVFLHHDALIEMAGVEFLLLGAAATAAIGRSAGLGARASACAGLLYALTPALALQSTACMNDGAVAALQLAALALTVSRIHPALALIPVALGASLKPTFLFIIPAAVLLGWLERRREARPLATRSWAAAGAGIAVFAGLFWYAANLVRFGNPVYPLGSPESVVQPLPMGGLGRALLERINALATSAILDAADHYTVQFILVAGWGLAGFACGAVALLVSLRESSAMRRLGAAFGLTLLATLLLTPPPGFYLRFILFFPALLMIAVARLTEKLPRLAPLVAVCAALTFLSTLVPGDLRPSDLARLTRLHLSARTSSSAFDAVPADATVACLAGTHYDSNGESYRAYGPGFSRSVIYLRAAASPEELRAALKSRGVGWVFPQARNGDGTLKLQILEGARQGWLQKEPGGVYRVLP